MSNYSPFVSKRGQMKPLKSVRYDDLASLKTNNIEEGYAIEYKSRWDKNFKSGKLCEVITSFANSDGGWLFVGIEDDGSICEIAKERSDFSQTISQCLTEHVSPVPNFDCKFLRRESTCSSGVLVIYVPRSENTPYLCNGTVYIRSGSSKIPIRSGRIEIDNLYKRKEKMESYIKDFCQCDIVTEDNPYAYMAVYLYKNDTDNQTLDIEQLEKLAESPIPFAQRINHCIDSVIFYNAKATGKSQITSSIELFTNGFAKVVVPLIQATQFENEKLLRNAHIKASYIHLDEYLAIDATGTIQAISSALETAFCILEKAGASSKSYIFSVEFQNIKNSFIYFPGIDNEYWEFAQNKGFRFSPKKFQKLDGFVLLKNSTWKALQKRSMGLALSWICNPFGYSFDDFKQLFLNSYSVIYAKGQAGSISRKTAGRIVDAEETN